jgi:hypothetical protein
MPTSPTTLNPIKHGLKVFLLCWGHWVHLQFLPYEGKVAQCSIALSLESFTVREGFCTLATTTCLWNLLSACSLCTTFSSLEHVFSDRKKSAPKAGQTFPFNKLEGASSKLLKRGWSRRACQIIKRALTDLGAAKSALVQCVIWKDSKVVGFISTALIGQSTVAATVRRTVGNVKKEAVIAAHQIVLAYLMYFGGADRADGGMSDFICLLPMCAVVYGPTIWSYYIVLLFGPTMWFYYMDLLYGPNIWTYYMVLLYGPTIWSYYMDLLYGLCLRLHRYGAVERLGNCQIHKGRQERAASLPRLPA